MKSTRLSGALLAAALPFVVSGVAVADPSATSLALTVAVPDGRTHTVWLTCEPTGGTHPNAKSACDEVIAAQGQFDQLTGNTEQLACTMEYRVVYATAEGTWRGMPVFWQREFGNACMMHTTTGSVFRL